MIKNVVVLGLGWQGKQFVEFFKKNNYNVVGVCRTKTTKNIIEKKYGINVYTDYKKCLDNKVDLLVLCAYPISIYEEVLVYSKIYDYKILSDLPVTFDIKLLESCIENKKFFLFLLEAKTEIFNNFFTKYKNVFFKINCLVLQNKNNLKKQINTKESILVDTQYMLNNLLGVNTDLFNIKYKFISRDIKDVEYIIEIVLNNFSKFVYKYEDGKGIIVFIDKEGRIIEKKEEKIIFDFIMEKVILDIERDNSFLKKDYFKNFNYLLTNFNYEKTKNTNC
ncbi:hypothetical protein EOM39_00305 [Candidatus Gracilibacteria bacterium]|nr:hypothetical protein [Candidatus Gracilibacteria bacterium]